MGEMAKQKVEKWTIKFIAEHQVVTKMSTKGGKSDDIKF